MHRVNFVCVLVLFSTIALIEARGGFRSSGSRRTSSGSSSYGWSSSRRVTSSPYNSYRPSYATSRPSYATSRPSYAAAKPTYRSSQIGTSSRPYMSPASTPPYNIRTVATVRSYPTQRVYYSSLRPVYATQRPTYATGKLNYQTQRPLYPSQSYPTYNRQPNYAHPPHQIQSYSPHYTPSYSKYPNYYQPSYGSYKKDHSVRNSVIAGLGGSALGMYLGYKLGSYTSGPNYGGYGGGYGGGMGGGYGGGMDGGYGNSGGYGGIPSYSVVHHYHHGEREIPKNFAVEENKIAPCGNTTNFCTPNTTPLCMTNGTVYCVAPISTAINCNETTLTSLPCLNTTISVPCMNATDPSCNGTSINETVSIPCVSSINVYGDFGSNKLEVHAISGNMTNVNDTDTSVTGQGISNKFCVTVIAEPVKIPKNMTNDEFLWYIHENPQVLKKVDSSVYNVLAIILNYLFY